MASSGRRLKNWLVSYLEWTRVSEAPESFHFWTGISTIAAVLQRKVWIDQQVFQWTPNFYIVFVGPPGVVTKSTTIGQGAKLLREIESVKFGPNSLTWNALTVAMEDAAVSVPVTPGHLDGELLDMSCVTCSIGELGTFLDPSDRKMVDVFTDLWDGQLGVWEHSTKTNGNTTIINPWLNLIGATTPSWLKENFPESMVGGGLTSRIVFVYGNKKKQLIPYPSRLETRDNYKKQEQDLLHDLRQMDEIVGEYRMTDEALDWGEEWYTNHHNNRPDHLQDERFGGYVARKQAHMHKLVIVLAAATRNERIITKSDMINADRMVTHLEKDMLKVFESIGASSESKNLGLIIKILMHSDGYREEQGAIYSKVASQMEVSDFNEALESGIKAQYIKMVSNGLVTSVKLIKIPDSLAPSSTEGMGSFT